MTAVTDEGYAKYAWRTLIVRSEPFGPKNVLGMPDNPSLSWWVDAPHKNFYCLAENLGRQFVWSVVPVDIRTLNDQDGKPVTFFVPHPVVRRGMPENWWESVQDYRDGSMQVPDLNQERDPWSLKSAIVCVNGTGDSPAMVLHFQKNIELSDNGNTNDLHLVRCMKVPGQVTDKFYNKVGAPRTAECLESPTYRVWAGQQQAVAQWEASRNREYQPPQQWSRYGRGNQYGRQRWG